MTDNFLTLTAILLDLIPGLEIRNKSQSWFWMHVVPKKLRDFGQCLPTLRKVEGRLRIVPVIWLPDHLDKDLTHLLAHEGQHALDMYKKPWKFIGWYLTRGGRAELELRAYMISLHSRFGRAMGVRKESRLATAEMYAGFVSSATYLWPCSNDHALERLLEYCAFIHRDYPAPGMPLEMMAILDDLEVTR
jgi:hypothetical protein